MRAPKYQYFSLDEYPARLDALRGRMESRGADVILVTEDGCETLTPGVEHKVYVK